MDVEVEILIVGLGPVGGALAGLLGQWGVSTLVVERDTEVYRLPRAAHFDHEIMRLFQQLGISDEIRNHVRPLSLYEFRNAAGQTLMRFDQTGRRTVSGWEPSYMFHQPAMEHALRRRLAQNSHIKISTGHRLTAISRNDQRGVTAIVAAPDGIEYRVQARFLVGADGGASLVRRSAAIELFDYGFEEPWIVVDAVAADESGLPQHGVQICDPRRPTTVMPMSPGRRRWEFMLLPGEQADQMLEDSEIAKLLSTHARPNQVEVVRKAVYLFHGLVAERWRVASVLLAGDAAHQMPPFMGQGMCSGLRDAANLAWKLALICKHGVDPGLLDTYQIEREPHVRHIVEIAIAMGRIVCTLNQQAACTRDQQMLRDGTGALTGAVPSLPGIVDGSVTKTPMAGELFPQPRAQLANGREGRLDDLMGHEFWLISTRPTANLSLPHLSAAQIGADLVDDGTIEQWLRKAGADAALIRPDRYVYATGDGPALVDDLRALLANDRPWPVVG